MTHSTDAFHSAMQALLAHLQLDARREPAHAVYTLDFPAEDAQLHCLYGDDSWFDVLAEAATLRGSPSAQTLTDVLGLNRPPVAVQFDAASGTLVAWGRLPLEGLAPQHSAALVEAVLERVLALRGLLRPTGTAGASADALLRVLQLPARR